MINDDGSPVIMPDGRPAVVEMDRDLITIDLAKNPREIDFISSNAGGVSFGIYRWEGSNLRIKQASPGLLRPKIFGEAMGCAFHPTVVAPAGATLSIHEYLLKHAQGHAATNTFSVKTSKE